MDDSRFLSGEAAEITDSVIFQQKSDIQMSHGYNLERGFYVQSYAAVRHRSPAGYGVLL